MKKSHEKSRFELIRADRLEENSRVVLQLRDEPEYSNNNYNVYLCETVAKEDYSRTTLEGQLEEKEEFIIEQAEEIETLQAKNEAMEEVLAEANDARQGLRNSMKDLRDENSRIYNALMECKHVFNGLPPEIEEILEARNDFFIKEPGNNE